MLNKSLLTLAQFHNQLSRYCKSLPNLALAQSMVNIFSGSEKSSLLHKFIYINASSLVTTWLKKQQVNNRAVKTNV